MLKMRMINPQRTCAARVTVVVLCLPVCLSGHAILEVCVIKSTDMLFGSTHN